METVRVSGPLSSDNGEIVLRCAVDGHRIILRSTWDVDSDLRDGHLVRVLPGFQQEADIIDDAGALVPRHRPTRLVP